MINIQFNECIIDPQNTTGPPISFTINCASIIIARSYASSIRTLRSYENKVATKLFYFLENTENYNFIPCVWVWV